MISVVMPAFNEARYLASAVATVRAGLLARGQPFELIVVQNGSSDDTADILGGLAEADEQVHGLSLPTADYGLALRTGIAHAAGERVVIFGVDHVDLAFMDAALERLASPSRPAVVLGIKRGPGAVDRRPRHRRLITTVYSMTLKLLFGLDVPDTHGVKALDRASIGPVVAACGATHDLFDSELVLRAVRSGLRVECVPVAVCELRPPRQGVLVRVPRTITGLLRLRWNLWSAGA